MRTTVVLDLALMHNFNTYKEALLLVWGYKLYFLKIKAVP